MLEIEQLDWNGFIVASTFSGCGGSCLGYRMAGYKVAYANEFIEEAQRTYKANHPNSFLDTRDIRTVQPDDVLKACNLAKGDLDILDGSPPCSAFSTVGKREKGWGEVNKYSNKEQRVDDLFFEYTRLLDGIQPKVFVAENVSGLVKGTSKGYFKRILTALKNCGYNVSCRVLDAQWLGVPQSRQRTIFVGVRKDLRLPPVHPKPFPYRYTLRDSIYDLRYVDIDNEAWCDRGADTPSGEYSIAQNWRECAPGTNHPVRFQVRKPVWDEPSHTLTTYVLRPHAASIMHPEQCRKFSIREAKRISGLPDDFVLTGTFQERGERLGRLVPPPMMMQIAKTIQNEILER